MDMCMHLFACCECALMCACMPCMHACIACVPARAHGHRRASMQFMCVCMYMHGVRLWTWYRRGKNAVF